MKGPHVVIYAPQVYLCVLLHTCKIIPAKCKYIRCGENTLIFIVPNGPEVRNSKGLSDSDIVKMVFLQSLKVFSVDFFKRHFFKTEQKL